MYHQFLAIELAYRGHLHEAYAADRRLLLDPNASRFSHIADPFLSLSLLGVIPESLAATTFATRVRAWKSVADVCLRHRAATAWPALVAGPKRHGVAGAVRAPRRAGSAERRAAPAASSTADTSTLPRSHISPWLERDSVRALRLFQSIPDTLCMENDCFYEKLIEARLLASQGQARQAGAVLDRWVWSGGGPLFVLGVLEQGRIAEGLGERQKARDSYQFVVDVWRHADPELQPFVVEARAALTRMKMKRE